MLEHSPSLSPKGTRARAALAVLLVVAAAGFVGCGNQSAASKKTEAEAHRRPRVLVLALDGLEPSLVRRFVAQGRMPNVKRLIENGSFTTIDCVLGTTSPVVWTSVATGRRPAVHGILSFTDHGVPVTSTLRRVPAFWDLLPRWGLKVATVGWLATWPAEPHSGIMITQRAIWGDFQQKVSPPGVIDTDHYRYRGFYHKYPTFLHRFTDYPYDPRFDEMPKTRRAYAIDYLLQHRLIDIYGHDTTMTAIAADLAAHHDLDLLAVYLQGADYTGHGFWQWFQPKPFRQAGWKVPEQEVADLGHVIPRYYQYLDQLVGRLVSLAEPGALVVLLSDHGFGPALGKYRTSGDFLSGNHRPKGTLILSGPSVRKGVQSDQQITHLDILPTLLWALHLPLSKELPGRPLVGFFTDQFRSTHPTHAIASYGTMGRGEYEVERSPEDQRILGELRSLGYIR